MPSLAVSKAHVHLIKELSGGKLRRVFFAEMTLWAHRHPNGPDFAVWPCREKRGIQVHHNGAACGTLRVGLRRYGIAELL